jgi:hypothetical protein
MYNSQATLEILSIYNTKVELGYKKDQRWTYFSCESDHENQDKAQYHEFPEFYLPNFLIKRFQEIEL